MGEKNGLVGVCKVQAGQNLLDYPLVTKLDRTLMIL